MALIPGFEYDIFISYVHDDNIAETDKEDGWVNQFYKYLDTKLHKHSKDVRIWWDAKNLDNSEVFDKSIASALDNSALMLCLFSRRYTKSDYCMKELEHFYNKALREKTGLQVGNRSRIIPIMMSNIHYDQWPERLSGTSSFKFHDGEDETAYGDPLKISTEGPFSNEMNKLRTALVQIIDDFPSERTASVLQKVEEPEEADASDFRIYMGEVSDSLYDRRDGIITELENNGFKVLLGDPSSADAQTHEAETREAIENAQLAVHILNEFPGRRIKGDPDSRYIQKQVEIGLGTDTPQLIWVPVDLAEDEIANKEHLGFLRDLEERSLSAKNYDFVRGNEGELAKILLDHARQLEQERQNLLARKEATVSASIKILLDTHIDDFKDAFNLKKILANNNIELIFNPEDGDPQENVKSLFSNISEAQKFIFLYGNEKNKDWVDIRVKNTMKKLMEYDRFKQDIYIYMTPPHKNPNEIMVSQSPLVKIINNSDKQTIDGQLLNELLQELIAESA